ncbi:uncharacterized protein [Nicotiana sylvestris]
MVLSHGGGQGSDKRPHHLGRFRGTSSEGRDSYGRGHPPRPFQSALQAFHGASGRRGPLIQYSDQQSFSAPPAPISAPPLQSFQGCQPQQPRACFTCGNTRHIARYCPGASSSSSHQGSRAMVQAPDVPQPSQLEVTIKNKYPLLRINDLFDQLQGAKLKEQNNRIEQIHGVSLVIKGVDIDKYLQQPWKPSVAPLLIPKKFKMPDIPKYDGTINPQDHVTAFTTGVKGNDLTNQEIELVLVKKNGETITKGALPENSIDSFAELADSFVKAHWEAQKVEKRMEGIFKIIQRDMELLREFVDRFQRERMMLPHILDNWAAMAFAKNPTYDSGSRGRDAGSSSKFGKETDIRDSNVNTKANIGDYSFNVSASELVAILRSMGDKVRWPKEMISNPNRRNPDFWCEFHNDHGHKTADYRLLQGEIEHLLKQGYLTDLFSEKGKQTYMENRQEPPKPPSPKRTINVINIGEEVNGVTYTAAKKTSKVTVTHKKRVRQVLEKDNITFDDVGADGVMIPYNDSLVIYLLVHDTNVKQILIDPGSFVNIILLRVVNEMQADDKMVPKARTLSRFDNSNIVTKGEIMLTTFTEGVVKDTKFQVIDTDMGYNMILGRPWIHDMDVVPSTLHQVIKFPSQWWINKSMVINRLLEVTIQWQIRA